MATPTAPNGRTSVVLVPKASIADPKAPTAAEITGGLDISGAISWANTTFPSATSTDLEDDRSLLDVGNAQSLGTQKYEATLSLWYPDDVVGDNVTGYGKAYQALRNLGTEFYVITRIFQTTPGKSDPFTAGQWISVYLVESDGWSNQVDGSTHKYTITFLTKGVSYTYTQVKNSTPPTVTNASGTTTGVVGDHFVFRALLGGKLATGAVKWTSSNPSVVSISPNGVATAVTTGTASITASHPAATGASTGVTLTIS